jgi:hypothetical protein
MHARSRSVHFYAFNIMPCFSYKSCATGWNRNSRQRLPSIYNQRLTEI